MTADGPPATDVLETLAANHDLVAALVDGPRQKQALADDLDVSPKTVYRRTRRLREHGLLTRGDAGYRLTVLGSLLADLHLDAADLVDRASDADSLLSALDEDVVPPYWVLYEADVVQSEPFAPNQPIGRMRDLVTESDALRGFSPVVLPQYVELFHERAQAGLSADLVVTPRIVEALRESAPDELRAALERDVTLHQTDRDLPYGLIVVDEPVPKAFILFYAENGGLQGVLSNDDPRTVVWARRQYETYAADAERVDPATF
ncbi:helix-turn-helix transcriptional regulator [Halarchaeum sp. P4]|uniref:helix-turn-helix transcriptional regulator n=1 Tax=Halarchaeum sp. P4 TaxID=3421639 RepID=UPI003EB79CC4